MVSGWGPMGAGAEPVGLSRSPGAFPVPKLGWGTGMDGFSGHLSKEVWEGAVELPGMGAGRPHAGDITAGDIIAGWWCQPNALPALGPSSCTITSVSFCLKMAFCALKCV